MDHQDEEECVRILRPTLYDRYECCYTFEPVLSIDAGFKWDQWFSEGDYHISIQAAWEHQLWILQNEYIKVPTETDHIGDLVLQGLTIKARFDF